MKDDTAPKKRTAKPKRVEVVDTHGKQGARGSIARPYENEIDAWLAKGWQRVNPVNNAE